MWTPTAVRACSLVLLTGLAPLAAEQWSATGVAALLSLLALLSAAALLWLLPGRAAGLQLRELVSFTFRLVALSVGAGWVAAATAAWLGSSGENMLSGISLVPAVAASLAAALYYAGAYAMSLPEAAQCGRFLRWQGEVVWRRCVGSPGQG
jgi:peptidoglycan biosynthesis protein MviN/MurJ (putative lipid II flippase)